MPWNGRLPQELGNTMFALVNTYTRALQFKGLSAENSYQLQRVGGNIWRCSINEPFFVKSISKTLLEQSLRVFHSEGSIMIGPKIKPTVKLIGHDGNAFSIMGRVKQALKRAGADKEYIDEYLKKATSGDYDNLLVVSMEYVDVE
jgi:hypothetical protein